MGQRSKYAAVKDVQTMPTREECASGMGERGYAAKKDAQIRLREEECVRGMGHITTQMMDLLHLDQNSNRLLQLDPNPMSVLMNLQSWDKV